MNLLCVEPKFNKTWGHNNQHVGLLKIATYHHQLGDNVEWVVYPTKPTMKPDRIYVTSLFTYFYKPVWEACQYYQKLFPKAEISLGGIYATLCPEHAKGSGVTVFPGQYKEALDVPPDIRLLPYKQDFTYVFSSWGCNRACTYCATHLLYGKGIRQVEPEHVVDWIDFISSTGIREVWFGDDNLLADPEKHIIPLCKAINEKRAFNLGNATFSKMRFKLPGGMAAKDFTPEIAGLMREADFIEISFAIESTSEEVRAKMGRAKNATQEDLIKALEYADKAGFERINTNVFFIIGLPYQKVDDTVDTLAFLVRLGVWAHPQRLTPIPGTVDWKRMGLEKWDLEDLYYGKFVAPNQTHFNDEDLKSIMQLARFFNTGRRMGSEPFGEGVVNRLFWEKLR